MGSVLPAGSAATPSCSTNARPISSRVMAEAVSVGNTILPKTIPTRSRSTRSVRASFQAC